MNSKELEKLGVLVPQALLDKADAELRAYMQRAEVRAAGNDHCAACGGLAWTVPLKVAPFAGVCWKRADGSYGECLTVKPEPPKAKAPTCVDCDGEPGVQGFSSKGLCWPCYSHNERAISVLMHERDEELRGYDKPAPRTYYDNSVAGIGVVPGIWRKHGR